MSSSSLPSYSLREVSEHRTSKDLWVVIEQEVYDLTQFQAEHPGGDRILRKIAGKDATTQFLEHHDLSILERYRERLQLGVLADTPEPSKGFLARLFGI